MKPELLEAFQRYEYPNDIGPGIYDIHSPRIPSQQEIEALILRTVGVLSLNQLCINPDCGLKTRQREEVIPALEQMVSAAKHAWETLRKGSFPDEAVQD